jgi:hypothetical protein
MGKPEKPTPVKPFAGVLTGYPETIPEVKSELETRFGRADEESSLFQFDYTDYYSEKMGMGLKKKFFSFRSLVSPGELAEIKLETNEIEEKLAGKLDTGTARPVNIDPGYVGLSKMVLATTKNYSHRIYLEGGIYAEVTLKYEDGGYRPQPWTYPDYRSDDYVSFFNDLREQYSEQLGEK